MIYAYFVPREDITAYELAIIVQNLRPGPLAVAPLLITFSIDSWESLDKGVRRHFEVRP